jgi:hypothetical protein
LLLLKTTKKKGFIWPKKRLFKANRKKKDIKSVIKSLYFKKKDQVNKKKINNLNNLENANKLIVKLF